MKRTGSGSPVLLPYLLIVLAAALRLALIHPYHLIPVFSCILFFGANRPKREFPIAVLTMVGADIFLTTIHYSFALTWDQAVTWIWYVAVMLLGTGTLRGSVSMPRIAGTSLFASVSFFLVSNFAVWTAWDMYPKTLGGLGACYFAALPFFRNNVFSAVVCSLLIFGTLQFTEESLSPARRGARVHVLDSTS